MKTAGRFIANLVRQRHAPLSPPPPPLAGEGRGGGTPQRSVRVKAPSLTLPRKRGRGPRERALLTQAYVRATGGRGEKECAAESARSSLTPPDASRTTARR